jgi:hypothetical protein
VRVRVESNWRTRVLVLLAILVAGVIALMNMPQRDERERRPHPTRSDPDVIEVELRE